MVSVIIPVYNAERTIRATVESVIEQSEKDIEIILVDDGSKDDSLLICKNLAVEDSRIRVIHQENAGASAARNKGLECAIGEWVVFADADDVLPFCAIEKMLRRVADNSDCEIVVGQWDENVDLTTKDLYWHVSPSLMAAVCICPRMYMPQLKTNIQDAQGNICMGAPWGKLIRRSILKQNNILFPEKMVLHEDTIFRVNMYLAARSVIVTNDVVYKYVNTPNSVSVRYSEKRVETMISAIDRISSNKQLQDSEYMDACDHFCMLRLLDCFKGNFTHKDNRKRLIENVRSVDHLLQTGNIARVMRKYRCKDLFCSKMFTPIERLLLMMLKMRMTGAVVCLCRLVRITK